MKCFILYGIAGSGKTTAVKIIQEKYKDIKNFAFGDKIKEISNFIYPEYDAFTQKETKMFNTQYTVRDFLLAISKPIKMININYFVEAILNFKDEEIIIIDGLRFVNEYEFFVSNFSTKDFYIIKVTAVNNKILSNDFVDSLPFHTEIINNYDNKYKEIILTTFEKFKNNKL